MKGVSLFLIFCAFCLAAGCGDDDATGPNYRGVILPLAIGNKWVGTQIHISPSNDTTFHTKTRELIQRIRMNDELWYFTRQILDDDTTDLGTLYANRPDGLWAFSVTDSFTGEAFLMFKYPAREGDGYFLGSDEYAPYVTVISIDSLVTVPGGTFRCYCYVVLPPPNSADLPVIVLYLAPNKGFIKEEIVGGFAPVKYIWELDSFVRK